jgi:hypothetical protein
MKTTSMNMLHVTRVEPRAELLTFEDMNRRGIALEPLAEPGGALGRDRGRS